MKGLEIGKALAASSSLLELLQLKVGNKLPVPVFQSSTGSLPDGDGSFQPCLTSTIGRLGKPAK